MDDTKLPLTDHLAELRIDLVAADRSKQGHRRIKTPACLFTIDPEICDGFTERFSGDRLHISHPGTGIKNFPEQTFLGTEIAFHQRLVNSGVSTDFS